jgi:hypothetical protein
MPRRIILHAGFHKTGTSSVQQTLRANRKLLMPALAMRLKGQMSELMHATRGYSTWRDPLTLAKATRRFGALLDSLPDMPRRCLVISAEELSGHMPGRGDLMDYTAAPILMRAFTNEITLRFPEAEQMVYFSTRARESWLKSAYWEHVKSSSMTLDFSEFAAAYSNGADFEQIIAQTQDAVDCPVHHTTLEDCADLRLGPADPLLDLCDIPTKIRDRIIPQPMANTRHSDAVLLALLDANRAYDDRDKRKAAKQAILAQGAQK